MAAVSTPVRAGSTMQSPSWRTPGAVRSPSNMTGSPITRLGSASNDPCVLLFRCRKQSENTVVDVRIQAGVSFHRFTERLSNEFGSEVLGFSFFSTATREEMQVGDESAFVKCKSEMLTLPMEEVDKGDEDRDGGDIEYIMDITVKVHQASIHGVAAHANRTAEQNTAVRRERLEARQARMQDLEKIFDDIHTAKTTAAEGGDTSELQRILDRPGAHGEMSIDATDGLERTALHYAAGRGRLEVVDALLNKGARVDTVDLSQQTPLHKAAVGGHTSVCRTLALALADTNAVDTRGVTPIMLSAKSASLECVQVLMRHGARTSDVDADGDTAMSYAPAEAAALRALLSVNTGASGKAGELRVNIEDYSTVTVAASSSFANTSKGAPQEHQQLNEVKNNLVKRLTKMLSELEGMDLKFAQGRGSGAQVMRQLSGIDAALQTAEVGLVGLGQLHLKRHDVL